MNRAATSERKEDRKLYDLLIKRNVDENKLLFQRGQLLKELAQLDADIADATFLQDTIAEDQEVYQEERGGDFALLKISEEQLAELDNPKGGAEGRKVQANSPTKEDTKVKKSTVATENNEAIRPSATEEEDQARRKFKKKEEDLIQDANVFTSVRKCKPVEGSAIVGNINETAFNHKWQSLLQDEDYLAHLDIDTIIELFEAGGVAITDHMATLCLESLTANQLGRYAERDLLKWYRNYVMWEDADIPLFRTVTKSISEKIHAVLKSIQDSAAAVWIEDKVRKEFNGGSRIQVSAKRDRSDGRKRDSATRPAQDQQAEQRDSQVIKEPTTSIKNMEFQQRARRLSAGKMTYTTTFGMMDDSSSSDSDNDGPAAAAAQAAASAKTKKRRTKKPGDTARASTEAKKKEDSLVEKIRRQIRREKRRTVQTNVGIDIISNPFDGEIEGAQGKATPFFEESANGSVLREVHKLDPGAMMDWYGIRGKGFIKDPKGKEQPNHYKTITWFTLAVSPEATWAQAQILAQTCKNFFDSIPFEDRGWAYCSVRAQVWMC
jgi:hypothetical protein